MSFHDELRSALDEFLSEDQAGEIIYSSNGTAYPAIVTSPSLESEFMPGMELGNRQIQARVSQTHLAKAPKLQSLWSVRNTPMRLTRLIPHKFSFLLILEDPNN
jgi:hypothetical protein